MNPDDVRRLLAQSADDEEPVFLSPRELEGLNAEDLPAGVSIEVGLLKEGVRHIELEGQLVRGTSSPLIAEMQLSWYRKYWTAPLGMGQYLDLLRRAIETRQRTRGDVTLGESEDDGAWVHLNYTIELQSARLDEAYEEAKGINDNLQEVADQLVKRVDEEVFTAAERLSGWGSLSLDDLLDQIEVQTTTDSKGRVLEELLCRLLETVPGFKVGGRARTETEEIDIRVLNRSEDPIWKREGALILAECKNWSSRCGKDEFVLFEKKLQNRHLRCSCGLLVSWNGFAKTVTKEMLRGSSGEILIIPIEGSDLRKAVLNNNFESVLLALWEKATTL